MPHFRLLYFRACVTLASLALGVSCTSDEQPAADSRAPSQQLAQAEPSAPATAAPDAPATAFDARVTAATGAAAAKKAPEAPRYDVYVKLAGVAETDVQVAQFISKLNASTLLRDVNLIETNTFGKDKETRRRFMLELMINPLAEVHDPVTGDSTRTATTALEK